MGAGLRGESDTAAAWPPATDAAPARYGEWLLRPLVDLGQAEDGPLYARAIEHYWAALVDPSQPRFVLQRILPAGFRTLMLREFGRAHDDVADPRALPAGRRTPRWQALCERLDAWPDLDDEQRCRLVLLLHGLAFFGLVAALVAPPRRALRDASVAEVDLLYWRETALYMLRMPPRLADYGDADLGTFDAIAAEAPHAAESAFNAAVKAFVHCAKTGADAAVLARRAPLLARRLESSGAASDAFRAALLASRYHRSRAFLPLRRGDRAEVVRHMDLAESLARGLCPNGPAERLMALENLHPVLESRAKEAVWLGESALALERLRAMIELDRLDPKSWLELGSECMAHERWGEAAEAFAAAALLGPPVGAMARHLAGTCLARMGQRSLAALMFGDALERDPLAISPRSRIASLPEGPQFESLKSWSERRFGP